MLHHKIIGYFAYISKLGVFCDGDACVISGSDSSMKEYLSKMSEDAVSAYTIKKTRLGEIMTGIKAGAAYCFDEESYNRFYPLAKEEGVECGPEDFTGTTPMGLHFVRVQYL